MKCKVCGYDDKKPLGVSQNAAKKGKPVSILLNENGIKYALHCYHSSVNRSCTNHE